MDVSHLLFLGGIQGILTGTVLWMKDLKSGCNAYLASFLIVLGLGCLLDNDLPLIDDQYLIVIWSGNSFLLAPLLYLYISSISQSPNATQKYWVHFIPFLIAKLFVLWTYFLLESSNQVVLDIMGALSSIALISHNTLYLVKSLLLVKSTMIWQSNRRHGQIVLALLIIFLGYNCFFLLRMILVLHFKIDLAFLSNHVYLGACISIYCISAILIHQPKAFDSKGKYLKSKLTMEDINFFGKQLEKHISQPHIFSSQDISIDTLSSQLQLDRHKLSQIVNRHFGMSLIELINQIRIKEVTRQLTSREYGHLSILGIAMNCGYNSKSTFNAAFKRIVGMTPSSFVKNNRYEPMG